MKSLRTVVVALLWSTSLLNAQSPPTITNQPVSQSVLPGTHVTFSAAADGAGPITYQWQFNGTNLPNGIISTVAGGGSGGVGGAATNASLSGPYGIRLDVAGQIYFADPNSNRVDKVDTNGIITTVAGNGKETFAGDGGAATIASLSTPFDVVLDAVGDFYIAAATDNRVRKVDTNGVISTVAGIGNGVFSGDGGAATNAGLFSPRGLAIDALGNLYIADTGNVRVRKVDTNGVITTVAGGGSGGDGVLATNAGLSEPDAVTLDGVGNLYISDFNSYLIRKVDTNGIITTVAGNGNYGYSGDGGLATNTSLSVPNGMTFDGFGNLYFADSTAYRVRKIDTSGLIATVAGSGSLGFAGDGGAATNAKMGVVEGVAFDASYNLYITDSSNRRIRKVLLHAGFPNLVLNSVSAYDAGLYSLVATTPYGSATSSIVTLTVQAPPVIAVQPQSQLAVAGTGAVFQLSAAGSGPIGYLWYSATTNLVQSSTNSTLTLNNVSTNDAGGYFAVVTNLYGSATSLVATLTVALLPSIITQPLSQTNLAGSTVNLSIVAGGTGPFGYQWRLNGTNLPKTVTVVAGGGASLGDGGPATNAQLAGPNAATVDAYGNVFISDFNNNRVRKVDTNGIIATVAGNGSTGGSVNGHAATNTPVYHPAFAVGDGSGNLFVSEHSSSYVAEVGTNGILNNVAGKGISFFQGDGTQATNAYVNGPYGIALDGAGDLFIADAGNNRIRRVAANGIISTVAGSGGSGFAGDGGAATNASLSSPRGVVLDNFGNLLIADTGNNRIRRVGTNGIITTIAGQGVGTFSGDGGAATNANLSSPEAVAPDRFGNLLIADAFNGRIREIDPNGVITTIAGGGSSYPGNGLPATSVSLWVPSCVAVDFLGNVFVDDNFHNLILELSSGPGLLITNIGGVNAGDYTAVVTSPYGSITSAVATLTVTIPRTPPQITASGPNFGFASNNFGFVMSGAIGQTIIVEGSTNLVDWIPLSTNPVNGGPIYFFDANSTNFSWRFYRARLP